MTKRRADRPSGTQVQQPAPQDTPIPLRVFGRHADQVSALGLGGYHLGKVKTVAEAVRIVHAAIDAGINFLDNAWDSARLPIAGRGRRMKHRLE